MPCDTAHRDKQCSPLTLRSVEGWHSRHGNEHRQNVIHFDHAHPEENGGALSNNQFYGHTLKTIGLTLTSAIGSESFLLRFRKIGISGSPAATALSESWLTILVRGVPALGGFFHIHNTEIDKKYWVIGWFVESQYSIVIYRFSMFGEILQIICQIFNRVFRSIIGYFGQAFDQRITQC